MEGYMTIPEMRRHFIRRDKAIHKDGVFHCPSCNGRVKPGHSYCHKCGKALDWRKE